jgi:hypothetical protein
LVPVFVLVLAFQLPVWRLALSFFVLLASYSYLLLSMFRTYPFVDEQAVVIYATIYCFNVALHLFLKLAIKTHAAEISDVYLDKAAVRWLLLVCMHSLQDGATCKTGKDYRTAQGKAH